MDLAPYPWQAPVPIRLGQATLLTGRAGVGKQHLALCLANSVLDNLEINPDYRFIPEGAGIDEVRIVLQMIEQTAQKSKVIVVASVESLSIQAQHALLKTLEEPPGDTHWLLVSSTPSLLLPTILSRCQQIVVPSPSLEQALSWLRREVPGHSDEAYRVAYALTQGGILKASEWLKVSDWQEWLLQLLGDKKEGLIVTQETILKCLVVWQMLVLDLLTIQQGLPEKCVFSNLLPSIEQCSKRWDPVLLGQWLEKLQYWQQQRSQSMINGPWLVKMLVAEWGAVC